MKYLASLLFASSLTAAEAPKNVNACLARPLELGAAITARLPEASRFDLFGFGLYNHTVRLVQAAKDGTVKEELLRRLKLDPQQKPAAVGGRRIHGSPSSYFISHYRSYNPLTAAGQWMNSLNLSSYVASAPAPDSYEYAFRRAMGLNLDADGAWQINELLEGRNRKYFDHASVIFGVDLLYWDTANWDCDQTHLPEISALRLIKASADAGKVLFIGTVPLEDGSKVPINSKLTGIENVWYENKHVCAENVNTAIRSTCDPTKGCYIVDLAGMAATLNADQPLFVAAQNRSFWRRQMRPDGVHVSSVGAQYVMEQMVRDFEANPPAACR